MRGLGSRSEPRSEALLALILASGCVDAGQSLKWPTESFELAFLVRVDGERVSVQSSGFRLEASHPVGLDQGVIVGPDSGQWRLVGLQGADLRVDTLVLDEARLLESTLSVGADPACEVRYDETRSYVTRSLPTNTRVLPLLPPPSGDSMPDAEALRPRLRIRAPVQIRACAPPAQIHAFVPEGLAVADGWVAGGEPRYASSTNDYLYFELTDAHYTSPDEALVVLPRALVVVSRGRTVGSETEAPVLLYEDARLQRPPGFQGGVFSSMAILPAHSNAKRQRFVVSVEQGGIAGAPVAWFLTLEREGREFSVVSSTTARGAPLRGELDLHGRALLATRDDAQLDSVVLWTEDGLRFERWSFPFRISRLGVTDDPARPHIVVQRDVPQLHLGDLTAPGQPELTPLGLDQKFLEGVRAAQGLRVDGRLRIFVTGEDRAMRYVDLPAAAIGELPWRSIEGQLDGSTFAASCRGPLDACNDAVLPSELAELFVMHPSDGASRLFFLPRFCAHLMIVRQDGCGTHLPLEPVRPVDAQRTMMSLRPTRDRARALLAGRGGRLFEVEFQP